MEKKSCFLLFTLSACLILFAPLAVYGSRYAYLESRFNSADCAIDTSQFHVRCHEQGCQTGKSKQICIGFSEESDLPKTYNLVVLTVNTLQPGGPLFPGETQSKIVELPFRASPVYSSESSCGSDTEFNALEFFNMIENRITDKQIIFKRQYNLDAHKEYLTEIVLRKGEDDFVYFKVNRETRSPPLSSFSLSQEYGYCYVEK